MDTYNSDVTDIATRARSSVDRVLASEAKGRRFDSCRAHQKKGGFDLHHAYIREKGYHLHLTY